MQAYKPNEHRIIPAAHPTVRAITKRFPPKRGRRLIVYYHMKEHVCVVATLTTSRRMIEHRILDHFPRMALDDWKALKRTFRPTVEARISAATQYAAPANNMRNNLVELQIKWRRKQRHLKARAHKVHQDHPFYNPPPVPGM